MYKSEWGKKCVGKSVSGVGGHQMETPLLHDHVWFSFAFKTEDHAWFSSLLIYPNSLTSHDHALLLFQLKGLRNQKTAKL